jgi:hypothetical protein
MADGWWERIEKLDNNITLRQGDYLPECNIVMVRPDFDTKSVDQNRPPVDVDSSDLIVITQSCDLEPRKTKIGKPEWKPPFVLLSPICSISEFVESSPEFTNKKWEEVRKGRIEGLYLLADTDDPENNSKCLVVDFREVYSLPFEYLIRRTQDLETRWRLQSPYLEHFAQAFARRFMRVGLPSSIPEFK